jgi:hypothetical protein
MPATISAPVVLAAPFEPSSGEDDLPVVRETVSLVPTSISL